MTLSLSRRLVGFALAGAVLSGALGLTVAPASAQSRTGGIVNQMIAGMGLKGYDPVNYFTDGKPAKGADKITYDWHGATWHFVSEEHRAAFIKNPKHFAPQYGGFCAWGVAHGKLFDVDPEHGWALANDKLYVNLNADILTAWTKEQKKFIADGNRNWPKLNR
nr:YHS domain-containing (seleno)protein [uncultured Gellertiella sp.]